MSAVPTGSSPSAPAALPPVPPTRNTSVRKEISRTVSSTKNLRNISQELVRLVRLHKGISSTCVADILANDAIKDIMKVVTNATSEELIAVEKNIRRRLYDALKVLISIGAVKRSRADKSLQWVGFSHIIPQEFQAASQLNGALAEKAKSLKTAITMAQHRKIGKLHARQQLRLQSQALLQLCRRNSRFPAPPQERIRLPFVVIRTPLTTEITMDPSEDADQVAFEFKGYYELLNDASIIDRMFLVDRPAPRAPQPNASSEQSSRVVSRTPKRIGIQPCQGAPQQDLTETAATVSPEKSEKAPCTPPRSVPKSPSSSGSPKGMSAARRTSVHCSLLDTPLGKSLKALDSGVSGAAKESEEKKVDASVRVKNVSVHVAGMVTPPRKKARSQVGGVAGVIEKAEKGNEGKQGFGNRNYGPGAEGKDANDGGGQVEEGIEGASMSFGRSPGATEKKNDCTGNRGSGASWPKRRRID